jgi:hypothetical protein
MMYDNPENIDIVEILRIQRANMGIGPNRNKRFQTVSNYSTNMISKEEWINKYCI